MFLFFVGFFLGGGGEGGGGDQDRFEKGGVSSLELPPFCSLQEVFKLQIGKFRKHFSDIYKFITCNQVMDY